MSNTFRSALAITWKELQLILKDRGLLAVLIILPLLFSTMISIVNEGFSDEEGGGGISLPVNLVNQDDGQFGQQVAAVLEQIQQLELTTFSSVDEATEEVANGDKMAVIIIPAGFSNKIDAYEQAVVEVVIDPVQEQAASLVTGLLNYALTPVTTQGEILYGIRRTFEQTGVLEGADPTLVQAAEAQTLGVLMTQLQALEGDPAIAVLREDLGQDVIDEAWNPWNLIVPGFAVMFAFFLTGHIGQTYHTERDVGTFRRLLAAPLQRAAIVGGPMLAFVIVVCLQVAILFGLAAGIFGMEIGNSVFGIVLVTLALAVSVATMGLMIGALTRNGKQADTIGTILAFVLALIGGAVPIASTVPLYKMGGLLGIISNLTPQAHATEGYRLLLFDVGTFSQVALQVLILLGFSVVFFLVAIWRLRFE